MLIFTSFQEAKALRLLLLNQAETACSPGSSPIPVDSGVVLPVAMASGGQSLLDLMSEYGQDSESETPSSPHPDSDEPEQSQQTQAEPWFDASDEKERQLTAVTVHARQLRRKVRQLLAKQYQTADALAQAQADLAREKLHSDLKIGAQLCRRDPRVAGFRNGKVIYAAPPETPAAAHVRIFGTSQNVGPGPFKDGSWLQWGKPNRPLTHKFVQDWIKKRESKQEEVSASKAAWWAAMRAGPCLPRPPPLGLAPVAHSRAGPSDAGVAPESSRGSH